MALQPATERGRRTRDRIVRAASGLVAERGALATSLDDVGRRAPASRSQLYHYFDDKADLLRAVIRVTNDDVLEAQADLFADLGSWEGLHRWADALVAFQVQSHASGGCPIGSLVPQLAEHDPAARAELAAGFDRWESALRTGLEEMRQRGLLAAGSDPAWLATVVLASVQGGLVLTQARRDPAQLRQALDGALALIEAHRAAC
ncbi:MAG: TetR/AcrR family transcriptional regulator [Actinomycetota bacterium]|nr:TetR/AcrR family transcriptional regulator [Actinomycetota bacterium]